jgi:hypothetical protein
MKTLITFIACLLISGLSIGQEFKLAHNGGKIIIADVDNVTITGYDGTEIIFSGSTHDEVDERAKGLKLVNSLGLDDNTGLGINATKDGANVSVTGIGKQSEGKITIKLPKNMGIEYNHNSHNGEDLVIENVSGEIEVSAMYNGVKLHNVTGPMAVKSVYGSIEATFTSMSQKGSISLNSVYDVIDCSIPASAAYDVSIRTPYGNIYSDVNIDVSSNTDGMKNISSKNVTGKVNGGGVKVTLKSGYDNIYLRKI